MCPDQEINKTDLYSNIKIKESGLKSNLNKTILFKLPTPWEESASYPLAPQIVLH